MVPALTDFADLVAGEHGLRVVSTARADGSVQSSVVNAGVLEHGLVAGGHATEEEVERHLANVAAGGMDLATAPMVSAWGRKPG